MAAKLKGGNGAPALAELTRLTPTSLPFGPGSPERQDWPRKPEKPDKSARTAAKLTAGEAREAAKLAAKEAQEAEKQATRDAREAQKQAENFFRIVHGKHEQLSALADNKAHIMLTINVGIIGICATQLFDPQLQYAAMTLSVTSLVAAALAVYVTMPAVTKHTSARPDEPDFDLAFFGDFARLPFDVYQQEMERFLRDPRAINSALARDLYWLGRVLNDKKYRYLAYCYRVFFAGLLLGALVLAVTLVVSWQ